MTIKYSFGESGPDREGSHRVAFNITWTDRSSDENMIYVVYADNDRDGLRRFRDQVFDMVRGETPEGHEHSIEQLREKASDQDLRDLLYQLDKDVDKL